MYDRPTTRELLAAVGAFLEREAMPALEGRRAFHARVAVNALAIVERELANAESQQVAALERLRALLGESGSLEELEVELCRRIRVGEVGLHTPGLLDHLRAPSLAKLAVDQPRYASYQRALEEWRPLGGVEEAAGALDSTPSLPSE